MTPLGTATICKDAWDSLNQKEEQPRINWMSMQNHVSPKGLYWKPEPRRDPASLMKYGEVIASINKSPDKTRF